MNLSGKKLTTAILAGLMGATMFGGSVFAEVTDAQFQNLTQGVNANSQRLNQLESAQQQAKDYSKDIAANKKAISDETTARTAADTKLQSSVDANTKAIGDETTARQNDVANLQQNITDSLTNQGKINETLTTAVQNNSKAIVDSAKNLEKHLTETDGRVDKANAEIHTNAGNIAQNKQDIADIQNTLKDANALASADATKVATQAAGDATAAAKNANDVAKKTNDFAKGLQGTVDRIIINQTVLKDTDLIKTDRSIGQNLTNVDAALRKEIDARTDLTNKVGSLDKDGNYIQQNVSVSSNLSTLDTQVNTNAVAIGNLSDSAVKYDADSNKGKVTLAGEGGTTITNVQAGDLSKLSTDAVNGSQLYAEQKDRIDADNVLSKKIGTLDTNGNYIQKDASVSSNLSTLDTQVKNNADAIDNLSDSAVKYDADSNKGKVTLAGEGGTTITNVQAGDLSGSSTDAVNGSQLYAEQQDRILADNELSNKIGTLDTNGNYIQTAANVYGNLSTLDTQVKTNADAIDTEKTAREAAVKDLTKKVGSLDKDGKYIQKDASVSSNLSTLDNAINKEKTDREADVTNLTNQISKNSMSINDLYGRYSSLKTDINKVGARSAALAGLHPLDFDPANKLNFAVASGSFKGENSVALGAFYRPNENIMFSAASTMGDSDNAYTFGLSFKIGPSSAKTKTTSPDAEELYKVVGELQDQLAAQQKEIEQLKADKAK